MGTSRKIVNENFWKYFVRTSEKIYQKFEVSGFKLQSDFKKKMKKVQRNFLMFYGTKKNFIWEKT